MKTGRMQVFILLIIIGTAFCHRHHKNGTRSKAFMEDIKKQCELISKYYKDRDFDSLANLYTADSMLMPPGSNIIKGRAGIKQLFQSLENDGLDEFGLIPLDVIRIKFRTAAERGVCLLKDADGTTQEFKHLILWKRGDDRIPRIAVDIWNSNSP